MTEYWKDRHRTLIVGDCRSMKELADESVQCVVTSPPYFGLRKYRAPDLVWGEQDCQHEWVEKERYIHRGTAKNTVHAAILNGGLDVEWKQKEGFCSLCGAWRGQLGLEPTLELYMEHLVGICREVKRVLRNDGVFWLNIDDSRAGSGNGTNDYRTKASRSINKTAEHLPKAPPQQKSGIPAKNLCLIPERLAIALQMDGWFVRSRIAWVKQSVMPESVRDRPTDAYETIWMLTKSPRYWYDAEAVREKSDTPIDDKSTHTFGAPGGKMESMGEENRLASSGTDWKSNGTRQLRNWWLINPQPSKLKHYAMYPETLVEKCIKASTPEVGCCPKCGKPWERVVERTGSNYQERKEAGVGGPYNLNPELMNEAAKMGDLGSEIKTIGWKAGCKCGLPQSENVGSIILDPFAGSGTTLKVAAELNRRGIGYEISEEYARIVIKRNNQGVIL